MTALLAGRAALVTGASQGLGKEIAAAYLKAGASVALCARDAAMLDGVRAELAPLATGDHRIITVPADVSKRARWWPAEAASHALAMRPLMES